MENNAITEFFRRVLSPAVGAHFDTSRSGKRHLKKIHRLQGTDPIVKVFFVKRVEFCRFCPAELTGSNRTQHQRRKHADKLAEERAVDAAVQSGHPRGSFQPPEPARDVRALYQVNSTLNCLTLKLCLP